MAKFRVGERVRFIEPKAYCAYIGASDPLWPKVGDTGEVIGHADGYVLVRLDNEKRALRTDGGGGWRFRYEWLEPALRFAVGDKVRVKPEYAKKWRHLDPAKTYVIAEAGRKNLGGVFDYALEGISVPVMNDEDLEPYVEPAKPVAPALLAIGTLVRLTDIGAEFVNERMRRLRRLNVGARAGDVVEIIENSDDNDELPYRVRLAPDVPSWCRFDSIEPVVPGDFRVGDKVRVVSETFAKTTWYHDVGTVFHVGYAVCANFARSGKGGFVRGDLEIVASNTPIEPYREPATVASGASKGKEAPVATNTPASEKKREFRVGDKVRFIWRSECCRFNAGRPIDAGASGEIIEYEPDSTPWHYLVKFDGDRVWASHKEIELIAATPTPVVRTIAVSNLRFTRKGERVVVEANGKRVATVSVEELRKMSDEMTKEAM